MSCLMFAYEIFSFRHQKLAYPDHLAFLTQIPKEGGFLPFHFSFLTPSFIQGVIQTQGLTRAMSRDRAWMFIAGIPKESSKEGGMFCCS